jgi:hypothetical protein
MAEERHPRSLDRGRVFQERVDAEPEHGRILTARRRTGVTRPKNPAAAFS